MKGTVLCEAYHSCSAHPHPSLYLFNHGAQSIAAESLTGRAKHLIEETDLFWLRGSCFFPLLAFITLHRGKLHTWGQKWYVKHRSIPWWLPWLSSVRAAAARLIWKDRVLDLLIFPTPLTLKNASITNEKLGKITTSRRGFQKASIYRTDPLS